MSSSGHSDSNQEDHSDDDILENDNSRKIGMLMDCYIELYMIIDIKFLAFLILVLWIN